ncbi:MAG: HIT family protein [Phycisphaerales bacterium JB059]
MGLIADRVHAARAGGNPHVIARLPSGWAVLGDTQPLRGYCLLLADPVAPHLNAMAPGDQRAFLADMARLGDAVLAVTGGVRINYEILGNLVPELHAHVIPRYGDEPEDKRALPPMSAYDWAGARASEPEGADRELMAAIRARLEGG